MSNRLTAFAGFMLMNTIISLIFLFARISGGMPANEAWGKFGIAMLLGLGVAAIISLIVPS